MKAIVLAAGYATRLYPLTLDKPKALLPIAGKPIINYIIEKMPSEVDRVFIVSNDRFYLNFVWWLEKLDSKIKDKIEIINDNTASNETRLGGVGDLDFVIQEKNLNDDLLIIAGDNLFDFSLQEFVDFFNKRGKAANALHEIEKIEDCKRFGVVEVDNEKIIGFEEKPSQPKTKLISYAVYLFPKSYIKKIGRYMKTDNPKDSPGNLIIYFSKIDEVYGFVTQGRFFDIGVIEDYEKANALWRTK